MKSTLLRLLALIVCILSMGLSISAQSPDQTELFDPNKGPLILVDNIPLKDSSELSLMNPSDIDSISVYKGESALKAYGSKGKNGVVAVYTQKGNFAEVRQVFYFTQLEEAVRAWQTSPKKTHFVLNGAELSSPDPIAKLNSGDLEDLKVMKPKEARKELGLRGKGVWYVITTRQ